MTGPEDATVRKPAGHDTAGAAQRCYNCLAEVTRAYCGECGQRHVPTRRGFLAMASEAIDETMSIDGKLFRTIWGVLTRPGALPAAYWAGQRQYYSSPFRIYIFASLIGFLVLGFSSITAFSVNVTFVPEIPPETPKEEMAQLVAGPDHSIAVGLRFFTPMARKGDPELEKKEYVLEQTLTVESLPDWARTILDGVRWGLKEPRAYNEQVNIWLSRLLIVFVGIIMLLLMMLFPRRYIVEHFVFAIHLEAFTLLGVSVLMLLAMSVGLTELLAFAAFLVVNVVYGFLAMKRAYANRWWVTGLKYVVFFVLYSLAMTFGAITVILLAGWSMSNLVGAA